MKKQIAFLIVILLTACSQAPQRPPNAEEQLATIAVKTQAAEQLGTIVAWTLTANPPALSTPIPSATNTPVFGPEAVPTGDAPIVSDVIACSPIQRLTYFKIDANTAYRNWEALHITINNERVICGDVPGEPNTLVCELPEELTYPATVAFALGDGIVGSYTFNEEQCSEVAFPVSLVEVYTVTSAQNVNLRTNPGLLFTVSRVMAQGTRLRLIGLSPGGDWALVRNNEGVTGWVDPTFLKPFPKTNLPMVEGTGVQEIRGSVVNADGLPMYGVNFAITQGDKRTDAKTNALGEFHAYLPASASGIWTVGFVSFDSESNALTLECVTDTDACGRTDPLSVELSLPTNASILFGWE